MLQNLLPPPFNLILSPTGIKIMIGIAIAAAVAFAIHSYGNTRYNQGKAEADTKWTEDYNSKVDKHNKKVADLEAESRKLANDLSSYSVDMEAKLSKVTTDLQAAKRRLEFNTTRHDASGKVVTECKATDVIYLGSEFTTYWNSLNKTLVAQ